MEVSIPMNIPSTKVTRSPSSQYLNTRQSLVECGSFFSASSVNHPRNSVCLSVSMNDPNVERKLSRTRKMSNDIRSVDSKRMASIPTQKEDITLNFVFLLVNQYLLKHGEHPLEASKMKDLQFVVQDCKFCVGDFSSTYAVDVTVPNGSKEDAFNFIVKMIPENDPCRVYVFETGLFEKENEIYFDLLPAIKFYFHKNVIIKNDAIPTVLDEIIPECFYGSHNIDGAGVLVFQSCATKKFKECQDPSGLNLQQLKSVVQRIAEFHAISRAFVVKHGVSGVQRRYPMLNQDMYSNGMLIKEISYCLDAYEQFFNTVTSATPSMPQLKLSEDDLLEMKSQFLKLKSCEPEYLLKNLRKSSDGTLTTIIHGELWERNIMLDEENNVKILDWKNTKLASSCLDLAFFLLSSTSSELRQKHTEELLSLYHETFSNILTNMKLNVEVPDIQELSDEYKQCAQFASLQALCMFVQEMHYMTENIAKSAQDKNMTSLEEWSTKLKSYEIRALTLFRDLDLSQIEDAAEEDEPQPASVESFDEF